MQQKNRMLAIRISELDLALIRAKASRANLTMTEYITRSALDKPVIVIPGLDRVSSELKYIGNNLNQITTLCNMGKVKCIDLNETLQGFRKIHDDLYLLMECY